MEIPIPIPIPIPLPIPIRSMPRHPNPHVDRMLLQRKIDEIWALSHPQTKIDDFKRMMPLKCIWTFPSRNFLKLNTDGSSKGNPGPSSYGGLIRDFKGRWLCGYMGNMSSANGGTYTALDAELWSIVKGLRLINDMNLAFVLIETDCLVAVQLIMAKRLGKKHPLKSVIDEIRELMVDRRCTVVHTKRDGNHCADQLAKLGGKQSEESVLLKNPPEVLIQYILRDIEGASEFATFGYHLE